MGNGLTEADQFRQAFVGDRMYFCGATRNRDTGLFAVDLSDLHARAELVLAFNYERENGDNCWGLTYDESSHSLNFIAQGGFYSAPLLMRCTLPEDGSLPNANSCGPLSLLIAEQNSVTLSLRNFVIMPNGDILALGMMSGDSVTLNYNDQVVCINPVSGVATLLNVNGDVTSLDGSMLTVVGNDAWFAGYLPYNENGNYARSFGRLVKAAGTGHCDYTTETVIATSPYAPARTPLILGVSPINGHVIIRWWESTYNRNTLIGVDPVTLEQFPLYNPDSEEAPGYYDITGGFYGIAGEYLFFAGTYFNVDGGVSRGLFAARWAEGGYQRQLISHPADEEEGIFMYSSDINGRGGNQVYLDVVRKTLVITGLSYVGFTVGLDVTKMLDGTLVRGATFKEDERLPRLRAITDEWYDEGSDPALYNVVAGDWAFVLARSTYLLEAQMNREDLCEYYPSQFWAINAVTRESMRILEDYEYPQEAAALKIEGLDALAFMFYGRDCEDGRSFVGIRIYDHTTLQLLGSVKMNPGDDTKTDMLDSRGTSNLVQIGNRVYFAVNALNSVLHSFAVPATNTAEAWAAALATPIVPATSESADRQAAAYYYQSDIQSYPMIAVQWGKVWYNDANSGCLTSFDPATGAVNAPSYSVVNPNNAEETKNDCLMWSDVITAFTYGPDNTPALIFSSNVFNGAEAWVITNNGNSARPVTNVGGWWSAFFSAIDGAVYFLSSPEVKSDEVLMKWDGSTDWATVVYNGNVEQPYEYFSCWGPYPKVVRDYYGPGQHAVPMLIKPDFERMEQTFSEWADNYIMVNVNDPVSSERLPRPADFWVAPHRLVADDSVTLGRGYFSAVTDDGTFLMASSSQRHGQEPYIYKAGRDSAPVLAVNIMDNANGWSNLETTMTVLPESDQAIVVARSNNNHNGLFQVTLGYLPPSPSASPSVSATPSPSVTPSTSFSATPTPTPSTSLSATPSVTPTPSPSNSGTPTPSVTGTPTPSSSSAPAGTPSVTPSTSALPKAKVALKVTVPAVTKADLTTTGAGTNLRGFVAAKASVPVEAVRITALVYYNTTTRTELLRISVSARDPINSALNRLRRLQNEPAGPDVSLELEVEVLAPTQQDATAAAAAISAILADPTALSNDPNFNSFQTALCSAADCSNGVVLGSSAQVVSLVAAPPAAEEKADTVGPGVGGFFGAAAGLLLIAGLYYYFYYAPAKAAKTAAAGGAQAGASKLVVRSVNPAEGQAKASFAPTTAV